MIKRKLKVGYLNRQSRGFGGSGVGWISRDLLARPKLVIANKFLEDAGFSIGCYTEVYFGDGQIIIKKV